MLTKLLTHKVFSIILLSVFFLLINAELQAQTDSSQFVVNKTNGDSINISKKDSIDSDEFNLDNKLTYRADDSTIINYEIQKAYLYKNAYVEYGTTVLKAHYIEIDLANNSVFATGLPDSTGKMAGIPVFKDAGDEYTTDSLHYNFKSRKGLVNNVTTKEDEAYVWISEGKKMPDNTMYVLDGHFTTCDAEHPHFRVRFKKGKVIPNDKIVTGPIYLEFSDIPTPLFLPFGFFPNKKGRANGILFPKYGYTENRGYRLSEGGYYLGLGPNADLALTGEIYSRGSWGLKGVSRYRTNYKYSGNIELGFNSNVTGDKLDPDYSVEKTFNFRWTHVQDPKANPNSNFSASVNLGSSKHNRLNSTSYNDRINSNYNSSIAYTAKLWQKYNLNIALNHNQNNYTRQISMSTPNINFSTPRFTPFERFKTPGKKNWYRSIYENIQLSYTMTGQNMLNSTDTTFLKTKFSDFKNGIQNRIPLSTNVTLGFFNWNISMDLNNRVYFKTIDRYYNADTVFTQGDTILPHLVTDTINQLASSFEYSINTGLNTRIYGMYTFTKGPVKALRHVMTPALSFTYRPDFSQSKFGYYQHYTDASGKDVMFSIFEGGIFGVPSSGKSGNLSFSLDNNFEMKVKSKKDTVTGDKKIKLIESLSFSTFYNLAAEKFNLAPLTVSARTTLFKKIAINFSGRWDFYSLDSLGVRQNVFYYKTNQKLLRPESFQWNFSMDYVFNAQTFKKKSDKQKEDQSTTLASRDDVNPISQQPLHKVDFSVPWSMNVNYNFSNSYVYVFKTNSFEKSLVQTLNVSGDISLSKNWRVGLSSGYDFQNKGISPTSFDIYRDLHCWELSFNWIPIGTWKSYNLTIRPKANMLQDMKYEKKKSWFDYDY